MYLRRGVGAGTPEVEEVVGGVEVEAQHAVVDDGISGFGFVTSLHTFPTIVHFPAVVERF